MKKEMKFRDDFEILKSGGRFVSLNRVLNPVRVIKAKTFGYSNPVRVIKSEVIDLTTIPDFLRPLRRNFAPFAVKLRVKSRMNNKILGMNKILKFRDGFEILKSGERFVNLIRVIRSEIIDLTTIPDFLRPLRRNFAPFAVKLRMNNKILEFWNDFGILKSLNLEIFKL
jgi:hypothetical protein